ERADWNQTKRRRIRRDSTRGISCSDHRAGDPHVLISAVQHSVRFDDSDAPGGRLFVRFQILLRLHTLFLPVFAADLLWSDVRLAAAAWRRRCLPVAEG